MQTLEISNRTIKLNLGIAVLSLEKDAESRKIQVHVSGADHWASAESGQSVTRTFDNTLSNNKTQ